MIVTVKRKMNLSEAKGIIRELKAVFARPDFSWELLKAVYDRYPWDMWENKNDFSPLYNQFTSMVQKWSIRKMKIGERTGIYFDLNESGKKRKKEYEERGKIRKSNGCIGFPDVGDSGLTWEGLFKVFTWTGSKIGKVMNLSWYESSGFAPARRVSITFRYAGMTFRGICSFDQMQCFNAKRIK